MLVANPKDRFSPIAAQITYEPLSQYSEKFTKSIDY